MDRGLNSDEVAEPNCFAIESTVAALTKGGEWLDQLNVYLAKNKQYVAEFLAENLSELKLTKSGATYLLWVDVSALTKDAQELCDFIRKRPFSISQPEDSIVEMAHRMSVLILPARLLLSKTEWNVCKKEYMLSRLKGTERIQPETGSKV